VAIALFLVPWPSINFVEGVYRRIHPSADAHAISYVIYILHSLVEISRSHFKKEQSIYELRCCLSSPRQVDGNRFTVSGIEITNILPTNDKVMNV
jgi:hypothetical protein